MGSLARFAATVCMNIVLNLIGRVKRYRMVKEKIRLLKDGIRNTVMETCCGLHNFRL
jgi:hypothetical protein